MNKSELKILNEAIEELNREPSIEEEEFYAEGSSPKVETIKKPGWLFGFLKGK